MPLSLPKWFGPALVALSLVGLGVSSVSMARRLSDRPELKHKPHFWFNTRIDVEAFDFQGERCEVTIDPPASTADATGRFPASVTPALVLSWRGQKVRFDFGGRYDPRLPGMLKHEDWFKLLPMVESEGGNNATIMDGLRDGTIKPRLIAAARYPAEGYDEGSWGLVRRREWRYRFAELLVDGPAESSIKTWDTTYKGIERVVAPGPYDKPVEGLTEEQRRERLWQYDAMIQVTPPTLFRAKDKVVQEGMAAMSWTWPVAGASVMGLMIGSIITASAGVRRTGAAVSRA
ncbi:MAG: hypothetical protein ACKVZJ_00355 [Phycisphaerales bacterium]